MKRTKSRAGLLMYRTSGGELEVLLAFPGRPDKVEQGRWELPKGKVEADEDVFEGALREFQEETGIKPDADFFDYLGSAPHNSTNITHIWSFEGHWTPSDGHSSNTFVQEWPPASGKMKEFMEVLEIKWFAIDEAKELIIPKQRVFLERLQDKEKMHIVINEDEPYQRAVKKGHRKMKMRLVGLGGNKKREKGHTNPSFKRSKSAPPGFGGT
jgi:predicted NUDIX family NTP pyrophosphohydrolase